MILEIGPGSGIMMMDIIRSFNQLSGSLRNVHIGMVEASDNLRRAQQDRLLGTLKERYGLYL